MGVLIMTHAKPQRLLREIAFELAVICVIGDSRHRVNEWRTIDSSRHLRSKRGPSRHLVRTNSLLILDLR